MMKMMSGRSAHEDVDLDDSDDETTFRSMDWEEEKRLGRIRRARELEEERNAARAYRARDAAQRSFRREDVRRLAEATIADARRWEDSLDRKMKTQAAERAAERLGAMMEEEERAWRTASEHFHMSGSRHHHYLLPSEEAWKAHEEAWDALEARLSSGNTSTSGLRARDIPFPPIEDGKMVLLSSALHMRAARREEGNGGDELASAARGAVARRSFVRASLRWHPDKFLHRFSALLPANGVGSAAELQDRFQTVSRLINDAWDELKSSGEHG